MSRLVQQTLQGNSIKEKRILHMTLKREWFDKIVSGEKKIEYRNKTPHWNSRLLHQDGSIREYDEIHFRNGYDTNMPFMRVTWNGMDIKEKFEIHLGEILELKNYP